MQPSQITAEAQTFAEGLFSWSAQALPNLAMAGVIAVLGFWLAGWAARMTTRFAERQRIDLILRGVLSAIVRYAILIVVLVAALGQLGVQTTSLLAALGAAGLAIGLALQGTLANVAAGFMLLWLRPFRIGDYIDTGSIAGTVKEVGLFATELHSWDNVYQFVPNAELWNTRVANYSRLPSRLVEAKFGIGYDDDIETGRSVLLRMVEDDTRVLAEPAPQVFVSALGDSAVELSLRAWCDTADYWATLRGFNENGKIELERAGLTIPYPQRDVHHHGLPAGQGPRPHNAAA